jgi:hypothetical protein
MTMTVHDQVADLDGLAARMAPLADELTWCVRRRDADTIGRLMLPLSVLELRALAIVLAASRQPRRTLPSDGIIDEVAVERAVAGEDLPLTRDERAAAAARLVAAGASAAQLSARLHVSGKTALALYQRYRG